MNFTANGSEHNTMTLSRNLESKWERYLNWNTQFKYDLLVRLRENCYVWKWSRLNCFFFFVCFELIAHSPFEFVMCFFVHARFQIVQNNFVSNDFIRLTEKSHFVPLSILLNKNTFSYFGGEKRKLKNLCGKFMTHFI